MSRIEGIPLDPNTMQGLIAMKCPICGDAYVHPDGMVNVDPEQPYGAAKVLQSDVKGEVNALKFWAECGSAFAVVFGHHKGMTYVHTVIQNDCRDPEPDAVDARITPQS